MTSQPGRSNWRSALTIDSATFYATADLDSARRIGSALWIGGGVITALILPLAAPDRSAAGEWGWLMAGATIAFAFAYGARLTRASSPASPNEILLFNYVAVGLISVLMWLSGSQSPYVEVLLLPVIYTAPVHPPRRTIVFVVAVGVALALPSLYAEQPAGVEVARFLIWSGLAFAATAFTARVRMVREDLRSEGHQARTMARVDPLTGLGNRRAFNEAMATAIARAVRTDSPLSLIVADLDSFKRINDDFGLPAGDRCLREAARTIEETVRRPDSCFRWGGDEFVVIADVDRDGAEQLASRLRGEVTGRCSRPDGDPLTLHLGTAQLGADGADAAGMIATASRGLKAASRSRTA